MYWILRAVAALINSLSPAARDSLARALARLAFDIFKLRRRVVMRNLGIAFPEKSEAEREEIGRQSYYHFALTTFELFHSRQSDMAASVTLKDDHYVREALAEGRGVYVLCMHLGNWEAMGAACTRYLAPSHVLVKRVGSSGVDRFAGELRQRNGFLTVKRQKKGDGLKAIAEVLKAKEIVGFVMDQARPGEPKLPFFGHPATTNTSLAAISRRYPAPIVPAYPRRLGFGKHELRFFPPLQVVHTDDTQADILRQSTDFNAVVESCIRQGPEQYFWMHNRWK